MAIREILKQPIEINDLHDALYIPLTCDTALKVMDMQSRSNKPLVIEIKPYREKRSVDANNYMWVLLQKIAEVIYSSKDDVYRIMLQRYGKFTYSIEDPSQVERVIREWKSPCEILGKVNVNGQRGVQIQKYYGSSGYNTKEMSVLIDGVVSEAQDLGIETRTPEELQKLKSDWKPKEEKR